VPIDEGVSRFNTLHSPFDLYEAGTRIGTNLGNTVPSDGARFKGRGYIQLTGRDNYQRVGLQIGSNLIDRPQAANDPAIAGRILAQFLKNKDSAIRTALPNSDLLRARKLINGGSHGFDRFKDTFDRGLAILPR
jgi:putative chitinase